MALAFQLVSKVIFQSSQKCESCLDQLQMDRSAGVLKVKSSLWRETEYFSQSTKEMSFKTDDIERDEILDIL